MSKEFDSKVLKQSTALVKQFEGKLKNKFIEDYQINAYTEKLKAYELIDSFGVSQVKDMIDYYFHVQQNPSWEHFLKNSNKIRRSMLERTRDKQTRKILAEQGREWLAK